VLESRGFSVERKPGLGATEIAFGALRTGAIDVYPEYTGTGLVAILHDTLPTRSPLIREQCSRTLHVALPICTACAGSLHLAFRILRHRGDAVDRKPLPSSYAERPGARKSASDCRVHR